MYPRDLHVRLRDRLEADPRVRADPGDRLAAVLIPMIAEPADGTAGSGPTVLFTRRTDGLSRHAGEISFPGGMVDPGDASLAAAALREADEELGLSAADVDVLGALDPVHTVVSRILVVPFVGSIATRPPLRPDPGEIAEVLEVPLAELAAVETLVEVEPPGGGRWRGWAYDVDGGRIWGATASMLHGFLERIRTAG
jgi:8-oxo-dGTP pyrophosphatase MutT (NUDIX family)